VLFGGGFFGSAFRWQPGENIEDGIENLTDIHAAIATACLAGGINGATNVHSPSVRSLG
jgi:hypothetical protein